MATKRVPQRRNGNAGKGKYAGRKSEKTKAKDRAYNATPAAKKKRAEANKARREAEKAGKNIKGKHYDHSVGRFVPAAENMGRRGEGNRVKRSATRKIRKSIRTTTKRKRS